MSEQPATVSPGAQRLLRHILHYVAHQRPVPSHVRLAAALGVTKRTVTRQIAELRAVDLVSTEERRQGVSLDHQMITSWITRGSPEDHQTITESGDPLVTCPFCGTKRKNGESGDPTGDHLVIRPLVGWLDSPTKEKPTNQPAPRARVSTETGRYLLSQRVNITSAARFQHVPLHIAQADFERRWAAGERQGLIVLAWEALGWDVEPPTTAPAPTPAPERGHINIEHYTSGAYGDLFRRGSDMSGLDDDSEEYTSDAEA